MAVGNAKYVYGANDTFGGHLFGAVDYSGPTSYASGGDAIDPAFFGFGSTGTIVTLIGSADQSGNYEVVPVPNNNGVTGWKAMWINLDSSGAQVPANFNLSGYTVRLSAIGY